MNTAAMKAQHALSKALVCPTCGKRTSVANVAGRGFTGESVTAETHCACPGGPAAPLETQSFRSLVDRLGNATQRLDNELAADDRAQADGDPLVTVGAQEQDWPAIEEESAAAHIRNAQQILRGKLAELLDGEIALERDDVKDLMAIERRLQFALEQIEKDGAR